MSKPKYNCDKCFDTGIVYQYTYESEEDTIPDGAVVKPCDCKVGIELGELQDKINELKREIPNP